MLQEALDKFAYPDMLVKEYGHWYVLLRKQQLTLGSLVLMYKQTCPAFSEVSPEGFAELKAVCADIERVLGKLFSYDKINYLMLMMVDAQVHYHVIPRYADKKHFEGTDFIDKDFPKPCRFDFVNPADEALLEKLKTALKQEF